jgi:hypothetical protein
MSSADDLYYRLDAANRIVEVGGSWDRFAVENGGEELLGGRIEGRSLFGFISGRATRDFVWTMLDAVRELQATRSIDYRCDSPRLKRLMKMTLVPQPAGGLVLTHRLVSSEPHLASSRFEPARAATSGRGLILRCSVCSRLGRKGSWSEPEERPSVTDTRSEATLKLAYGVCPHCVSEASQVFDAGRKRRKSSAAPSDGPAPLPLKQI